MNIDLVYKLILNQFPEYAHLTVADIEKQGRDNWTYRLGDEMLVRIPTAEVYAQKISIEQILLPQLAKHLNICIPVPVKMGMPSIDYPYPFSIYQWLPGISINLVT